MGIVYPSEAVARRWDGALKARLSRSPLEKFLRERSIATAPAGIAQDSDNLARATVSIVAAGLSGYFATRTGDLTVRHQQITGHIACLVSCSLAGLILQPAAWRIAALVSTAQLLSPWIGPNAAALASASSTREFQHGSFKPESPLAMRIGQSASAAVNQGSAAALAEITGLIAEYLHGAGPAEAACSAKDARTAGGSAAPWHGATLTPR
jgi:hypothetical protein